MDKKMDIPIIRVFLASIVIYISGTCFASAQEKTPAKGSEAVNTKAASKSPKIITLESTIVGNKEQPKMMTIVPWQTPTKKAVKAMPISIEMQSFFEPIEVDSLKKELEYFNKSKK